MSCRSIMINKMKLYPFWKMNVFFTPVDIVRKDEKHWIIYFFSDIRYSLLIVVDGTDSVPLICPSESHIVTSAYMNRDGFLRDELDGIKNFLILKSDRCCHLKNMTNLILIFFKI